MEPLPDGLVESLAEPAAYPDDASAARGVAHVQTHISHVFLTATRVYKLRKAVSPGFLDFGARAARNDDCERELRLNRRLAPDVYLGIAPLVGGVGGLRVGAGGGFRVGALGEAARADAEHVVVMRRLPDGCDALSLLARGALGRAHLLAAAARIAAFHRSEALGAPAPFSGEAWLARIDHPMRDTLGVFSAHAAAAALEPAAIEGLGAAWAGALAACAGRLEARRLEGRAVDGHGDLHLAHLWFEAGPETPLFIDCIEFSDELRRIDAASDVAFLTMDLAYRGHEPLGELFLARYAEASGDHALYDVVDLYAAYRAAVRAMVAALAAADREIAAAQREAAAASAARHLALARRLLTRRGPGALVLVGGSVGTGKSSVAAALCDATPAVVWASDRVRKTLAGLAPEAHARAAADAGLYTAAWNDRTYAALLERAGPALRSGRLVVLDATWASRRRREAALAFARGLGAPAWFVRVDCAEATALERVRRRAARGDDPSDAGPERVAPSRRAFEPPDEWPPERRLELATDLASWRDEIPRLVAQLRTP
jgi:aminoglycoside phosphotransferase family enzyme/predicted kinase